MRERTPLRFVILGFLGLGSAVWGATYVIHPDGTGDFATIQAAVSAVSDGDVIELTDGVFGGPGNRNIDTEGKAITIRSQSGIAEDCVIDVGGSFNGFSEQGFYIHTNEGPDTVIRDLTIMNGVADGP